MKLMPGRTVVHPHHGPATVTQCFSRKVRGADVEYIELRIEASGMEISFPAERAEYIGIRALAGAEEMAKLAEVLAAPSEKFEKQWSRRIKAQQENVNSGDPLRIAAVLRDLVRRDAEDGLGMSEKQLLKDAGDPLTQEIMLSVGRSEDEVLDVLRTIALEQSTDVLATLIDGADSAADKKAATAA